MSELVGARRRPVQVWVLVPVALLAVTVGAGLGRTSLFGAGGPEAVVGEATLTNKHNGLTIVKSEDLVLDFDGRTVAWVDEDGIYFDAFSDKKPPCLRINTPVRMEVSYLPLPRGGGVGTQVRCLTSD